MLLRHCCGCNTHLLYLLTGGKDAPSAPRMVCRTYAVLFVRILTDSSLVSSRTINQISRQARDVHVPLLPGINRSRFAASANRKDRQRGIAVQRLVPPITTTVIRARSACSSACDVIYARKPGVRSGRRAEN